MHQICKDDKCWCYFDESNLSIQDSISGKVLYQGRSENGVYLVANHCLSSTSHSNSSWMLWHTRLGYPYFQVLHNTIPSLNVPHHTSQLGLISCEQCLHGKMHRSPFPKSCFQAFALFKLFNSDLWGPAPVTSINGYQYC